MIISPLESPYRITQGFGQRPNFYRQFGIDGHDGLDFASDIPGKKVPCYACYDGLVVRAGWSTLGYGQYVLIKTDKDGKGLSRELLYAHLDKISVKAGDRVYLGDEIGIIGTTGNSSGVHLHLAVRKRDKDGIVVNYDNGFKGRYDYEPYLLDWKKRSSKT